MRQHKLIPEWSRLQRSQPWGCSMTAKRPARRLQDLSPDPCPGCESRRAGFRKRRWAEHPGAASASASSGRNVNLPAQYASPTWQADSRSFHYSRLQKLPPDAPPSAVYENQRVYFHILGTDPEKDPLVFGPGVSRSLNIPKAGFVGAGTTPGSAYAVAFYSAGTTDPVAIYVAPADKADNAQTPWRKIVSSEDL